jgi:uncharacterized membrane protein
MTYRPHSQKVLRNCFALSLGIALASFSTSAMAKVDICNQSGHTMDVAIAYTPKDPPGVSTNGHRGTTAEGWWTVANGDCAQVSSIHAGSHWLYIRGKSKSEVFEGDAMLCVAHKAFTISQQFKRADDRCGRDQYLARFKRVDMNTDAKNYRFTIK